MEKNIHILCTRLLSLFLCSYVYCAAPERLGEFEVIAYPETGRPALKGPDGKPVDFIRRTDGKRVALIQEPDGKLALFTADDIKRPGGPWEPWQLQPGQAEEPIENPAKRSKAVKKGVPTPNHFLWTERHERLSNTPHRSGELNPVTLKPISALHETPKPLNPIKIDTLPNHAYTPRYGILDERPEPLVDPTQWSEIANKISYYSHDFSLQKWQSCMRWIEKQELSKGHRMSLTERTKAIKSFYDNYPHIEEVNGVWDKDPVKPKN